jgi:Kef-type K+ transport system membrane component KefB
MALSSLDSGSTPLQAAAAAAGMSPFMQLVLALAVLIAAAKIGGLLALRLKQPAVLGELLVGLMLGPSLLDFLHLPFFTSPTLQDSVFEVAELGVIFLMFVAGLEVKLPDLLAAGKVSTAVGVLGVVVPLLGGFALAWYWPNGYSWQKSLFIGILLTATSVSISAQTLLELGKLRSRVGLTLLGAAIVDDILVIIILSAFVALTASAGGGLGTIGVIIGVMLLYFGVMAALGMRLLPWLIRRIVKLPISQPLLSVVIVLVLLAAWSAESLGGVASITGAFLMGIFLGRTPYHNRIEDGMQAMTYAFFVPIFFASIGLHANVFSLPGALAAFAAVLCLVAIVTKMIGCGLGALLGGMSRAESAQVGLGMISRGEVGLIVATVGIREAIISEDIFAVTVLMVLVTTIATPLLLRWAFSREASARQAAPQEAGSDG